MKNALIIEPNNCPERIILDATSENVSEVIFNAKDAIQRRGMLAYIWRREHGQIEQQKNNVEEKLFKPIVSCLPSWVNRKYRRYRTNFEFQGTLNYSISQAGIEHSELESEFRVETFGTSNFRHHKNYVLLLPEEVIQRGDINQTLLTYNHIVSYPFDSEIGCLPHVDGGRAKRKESPSSLSKFYLRVLTIHKGEGTFFWGESVADLGGEDVFTQRSNVDPSCLEQKQAFQSKEGDVLIFQSKYQNLSDCFIHQGCPSVAPTSINRPDVSKLRFVEVCDLKLNP